MMMLPRLLCALASGFLAVSNGAVLVEKYGLHNDMILQATADAGASYRGNIFFYASLEDSYEYHVITRGGTSQRIDIDNGQFAIVQRLVVQDANVEEVHLYIYDRHDVSSSFNPLWDSSLQTHKVGVSNEASGDGFLYMWDLALPDTYNGGYTIPALSEVNNTYIGYDVTDLVSDSSGGFLIHLYSNDFYYACQQWWSGLYSTNLYDFVAQNVLTYDTGAVYEEGYKAGTRYGEQLGYDKGYQDGVDNSQTAQGGIIALFGAVANVPIQVLNGLGGLAVWHVPIVGFIVSFLLIAVVAGIIRRFI